MIISPAQNLKQVICSAKEAIELETRLPLHPRRRHLNRIFKDEGVSAQGGGEAFLACAQGRRVPKGIFEEVGLDEPASDWSLLSAG